jgi:hypothetical protein
MTEYCAQRVAYELPDESGFQLDVVEYSGANFRLELNFGHGLKQEIAMP